MTGPAPTCALCCHGLLGSSTGRPCAPPQQQKRKTGLTLSPQLQWKSTPASAEAWQEESQAGSSNSRHRVRLEDEDWLAAADAWRGRAGGPEAHRGCPVRARNGGGNWAPRRHREWTQAPALSQTRAHTQRVGAHVGEELSRHNVAQVDRMRRWGMTGQACILLTVPSLPQLAHPVQSNEGMLGERDCPLRSTKSHPSARACAIELGDFVLRPELAWALSAGAEVAGVANLCSVLCSGQDALKHS